MWGLKLALILAGLYGAVLLGMYFAQTWLLFPTTLVAGRVTLPASAQRLQVETPGGDLLIGVHVPASSRNGQVQPPLLLGFGGNAWNADAMALYLHGLVPECDVVAFHYRGYSPSTGRPSAEALLMDAPIVFDHVRQTLAPRHVIAVGFSIGSGVAAYLARGRPVAGLILVTPFDSLKALARDHYWWAPVGRLLRHQMPVIDFVRDTRVPTALIVASEDTIVPARRSAPLRGAIPNLILDRTIEAGHNDLYEQRSFADATREAIARIVASDLKSRPMEPDQSR
jgi:pimeloyl-ACP methyl ester carboxylesterase